MIIDSNNDSKILKYVIIIKINQNLMIEKLKKLEEDYSVKRENFIQTQNLAEKLKVELIGMEAQIKMLKEMTAEIKEIKNDDESTD